MNFLTWPFAAEALSLIKTAKLSPRLRLHPHLYPQFREEFRRIQEREEISVEWVIDPDYDLPFLNFLDTESSAEDEIIVIVKNEKKFRATWPMLSSKLKLPVSLYPPFRVGKDVSLTAAEMADLYRDLGPFRPLSYEVFDPRIKENLDLEPLVQPEVKVGELSCFDFSIVIPVYNNWEYLQAVLRHLSVQTNACFEVIVVDDGSSDDLRFQISDYVKNLNRSLNFKYIYFPRKEVRARGDNQFRAGVARNLGVKHATGRLLLFLDSDVLVPPNFLETQKKLHERFDVVQGLRLNLIKNVSSARTDYEGLNPEWHTEAFEGNYWYDFFSEPQWMNLPFFWKYTCTYALSLSRSLFFEVGRLRRTYFCYGFEDVDLGLRLAQKGCRFGLNRQVLYHLYHRSEASEFKNSSRVRHQLLTVSAGIFYRNNPDPEVQWHFRHFLSNEGGPR